MIWGENIEEYRDRVLFPRNWYAWHPVMLEDGRWVWFEKVLRYKTYIPSVGYPNNWNYRLR